MAQVRSRYFWIVIITQLIVICALLNRPKFNEKRDDKVIASKETRSKESFGVSDQLITRVVTERPPEGGVRETRETIRTLAKNISAEENLTQTSSKSSTITVYNPPRYLLGVEHPVFQPYDTPKLRLNIGILALDIPQHSIYITTNIGINLKDVRVGVMLSL